MVHSIMIAAMTTKLAARLCAKPSSVTRYMRVGLAAEKDRRCGLLALAVFSDLHMVKQCCCASMIE